MHVPVFYGIRILATLVMVVVSLMVQAKMPANPAMTVALVVFGRRHGLGASADVAGKEVKKRQEILRLSLPDALDLMVVSVEAGSGPGSGDPARGPRTIGEPSRN